MDDSTVVTLMMGSGLLVYHKKHGEILHRFLTRTL